MRSLHSWYRVPGLTSYQVPQTEVRTNNKKGQSARDRCHCASTTLIAIYHATTERAQTPRVVACQMVPACLPRAET